MEDSPTINKHCGHGQYIDIPLSIIDSATSLEDQIVDREIAIQEREMDVKEHNKKEKRKRKRGRVKKNKMELSQSYGCEKSVDISEIKTVCHPDREKYMVSDMNDMTTEGVNEIVAQLNQKEPNIIKSNENIDNYCSQNMLDCSLLTDQGLIKNMPDNVNVSTEKLNTIDSKKLLRKTGKVGVDLDRRKNSMLKPKFTQRSWLDDDADGEDPSEADILMRNDQALDPSSYCFIKPSKSSINACNIAVDECTSSIKLVADDVQNSTKLCESIDDNDVKISDCFDIRINQKCQKVTNDFVDYETVDKFDQNEEKCEIINEADESSLKNHLNKEKSDFDRIAVKKLSDKICNYKMKMNDINHEASLDSDNENLRAIECSFSKSLPTVLQDHTSIQLNAYKNRFTGCTNMQNYEQSNMNNLTCVKKDVDVRIGTNVNDLKNDRIDKIKRSRRKTEPFDFELQSDGVLMKNNKPKYENASNIKIQDDKMTSVDNQTKKANYINSNQNEKPAFDSNQNEKSRNSFSGTDKTRNLFSGFISDSGVFVPTSNMDKRSSRDSLDRIFDEECSEDDSLDDYDVDFEDGDGSESENGSSDCRSESEDEALPPEPQLGNVEYKLKLVTPTKQRFEHLVTQMKWRLREGRGEALYEIGVRDCGRVRGLSSRDLRASLRTLRRMAARLGAACALLTRGRVPGNPKRERAEVLVRKIPDDQHNIEVRVAVMGSNDAGKSTLVGVLTQGELDNGRGRARLNMFRHLHEVRTGRTSSVSHEILGFDPQGHPINYAYSELMTSEEIAERSSKLVSFIDLAGHRKYLKTTVQGLTGYSPHYAMLVVSATAGINQMTLEHLALVTALDLPFFIAVTKIDSTSPEKVIEALRQALNTIGCRKVPLPVLTQDDVILAASNALSRVAVPVFPVSSVSGCGLDRLGWFLFLAPPAMATCERDRLEQEPVEFQIDETFKVGGTSGPVVGGLLTKGVLTERTRLLIGPLDSGDFVPITVISLHRNKAPCRVVRAGQAASLGLSVRPPTLRQGMVILAIPDSYPGRTPNHNLTKTSASSIIQPKIRIENEKSQNLNNKEAKLSNQVSPRSQKNKMISEGKESNLKIRQEDIVEIVDGIGTKGVTNDVNVIKQVDDNDKLERLSPSRYTNRFVSSFGNVCTIPSASIDIDIDSIEGFDEESNGNETESLKDEDKASVESDKVIAFPAKDIDEGILKEDPNNPRGCYCFQATVSVLYHSTAIYPGFQATVHIGNIRQTAVIEGILAANSLLRAKDRAPVVFRFVRHPEYVKTGAHLLFREGLHTKGIGVVTQVFPHGSSDAIQHDK